MTDLWFNPDAQFIGAIGPATLRELAEAIYDDESILPVFEFEDDDDVTIEDIENAVDHVGLRFLDIDEAVVFDEAWADTAVHESSAEVEPRPGTTRVLGVHL